jgi:hypothetical protein
MDFQFAAIAGAGIDLANGKTAAEAPVDPVLDLLAHGFQFAVTRCWFGGDAGLADFPEDSEHGTVLQVMS